MEAVLGNRTIVCLCGSTWFLPAIEVANRVETLKGKIVLSVGVDLKARDLELLQSTKSPEQLNEIKMELDRLHKDKVRMAHEILVLDIDEPYKTGQSTTKEVELARSLGKRVRWWSEEGGKPRSSPS